MDIDWLWWELVEVGQLQWKFVGGDGGFSLVVVDGDAQWMVVDGCSGGNCWSMVLCW